MTPTRTYMDRHTHGPREIPEPEKPTKSQATMLSEETKNKILQYWKDPRIGITGLARFRQKLKGLGIHVNMHELKTMLHDRPEHALF